ncbi:MAG: hypothetical protein IJ806_00400 [Ruminococcus sp.]|nr:hypothetical protein [Ruminococcus sp.]
MELSLDELISLVLSEMAEECTPPPKEKALRAIIQQLIKEGKLNDQG